MSELFSRLPQRLLPWYVEHQRRLPWREDCEPYHVWLSEVMLQQTRVEAVKGYYVRFLEALPTIEALAAAPEPQVHKLWEGLGYYSRVRNLQKAAQQIQSRYGGQFPRDYCSIRELPGVGDYTAGAIASICFELPTPAVDGNVLRVASRLCADDNPINRPQVKKRLTAALAQVYPVGQCGTFTQALMELGATVCVPNGAPDCGACPLADLCLAHQRGIELMLPVKDAKRPRRLEERTVFLLRCEKLWAVRKRPGSGLLAGLWEFPNVLGHLEAEETLAQLREWKLRPVNVERSTEKQHIFTHVQWNMRGWYLQCAEPAGPFEWVSDEELQRSYALPTAFRIFLN